MSERLRGIGVSPGVAVGPVAVMGAVATGPPDAPATGAPEGEAAAARAALEEVAAELEARGERAGGDARDVLGAQALMARDPGLAEQVEQRTAAGAGAARAVWDAFATYREALAATGGYLAARVADLDDVRDRTVATLLGLAMPGVPDPGHPFVLVARDLAPADTAALDRARVLAFVTEEGGPTSHTAILARAMGVPAVAGCAGATRLASGTVVVIDGATGTVLADPGDEAVAAAQERARARRAFRDTAGGPGATADGHRVALLANVGDAADVEAAVAAGAEGIGLYRTELLFLDRADPPGVDEQVAAYQVALAAFAPGRAGAGARVVVRTLDAGADKPLPFLDAGEEPNPALGRRGLRALRQVPGILAGQLEAIGRAAAATGTRTWVMAPMVATAAEAAWFVERARRQPVERAGVMVEVPAAALCAGPLLAAADFASIGTNDLAQYTFAADRQLGGLAAFQDPWQPALLRLVAAVGTAGRETGKPVGVCGEAAADPLLALVLVGLGVTSLSMAPASIADVRALLGRHRLDECEALARLALEAADPAAGRARVRDAARVPGELAT